MDTIRKILISVAFLVVAYWAQAQEVLVPIQMAQRHYSSPKSTDTIAVKLPFFDDFSDYEGAPKSTLWLTPHAFVNKDFASNPPTVGMATLDALDAHGNLYLTATTSCFSADTLVSQPIRMDSLFSPYTKRLQPSDSVYLSFYYLPGGGRGDMWERIGDAPDVEDSLFLEFFNPTTSLWTPVWSIGGISVDSLFAHTGKTWQYVTIAITNSDFFSAQFQFRFRNYCSLDNTPKPGIAANTDQWNLDYIYIGHNRTRGNNFFRDVAFVSGSKSLLSHYSAMPARQFRISDMAPSLDMTITNLYSQTLTSSYHYDVYDPNGNSVAHYDGGYENIAPFFPSGNYQTVAAHAQPVVNFAFNLMSGQQTFRVVHVVTEGVSGDQYSGNDTLQFDQVFADYYAYDDGTPENGYGLTSTSSKVYLASQFSLNVPDTLGAVDLYFNQTRDGENAGVKFFLCVWEDNDGVPGNLIYKDAVKQTVSFDGLNQYVRYRLSEPIIIDGNVFIGFEQQGNTYINMGFDRNNDARAHTYYRTSSQWQQSILSGALMLRPCFGAAALQGIEQALLPQSVRIYPNPVHDVLTIDFAGFDTRHIIMSLHDMQGRAVYHGPFQSSIQLSFNPTGMYFLILTDTQTGWQITRKIIKK